MLLSNPLKFPPVLTPPASKSRFVKVVMSCALAVTAMEKNRVEGAQNVQWALLNLVEFLYNF